MCDLGPVILLPKFDDYIIKFGGKGRFKILSRFKWFFTQVWLKSATVFGINNIKILKSVVRKKADRNQHSISASSLTNDNDNDTEWSENGLSSS